MKLLFEIAIALNVAIALLYAWAYFFSREVWWPVLTTIFEEIRKSGL